MCLIPLRFLFKQRLRLPLRLVWKFSTIHPDCYKLDTAIQSDLTIHPNCYKLDAAIQCSIEKENKENLPPQDSSVEYIMCEWNKDEKFYPLVEKHKGVFKDVSG